MQNNKLFILIHPKSYMSTQRMVILQVIMLDQMNILTGFNSICIKIFRITMDMQSLVLEDDASNDQQNFANFTKYWLTII